MAVNIVTGRRGEAHITSDDDRARNIESFGHKKFIFNAGKQLWATKIDDNTVQIADGMCMSHGTQMGIERGQTETVHIDNGVSGYKRHDFICMRYTKNTTTQLEQATLIVHKGTQAIENPSDPLYEDGDPMKGAELDDAPLWRVVLNGTSIEKIEALDDITPLRNGKIRIDPDDPTPEEDRPDNPNANVTAVITPEDIDRIWGSGFVDGDDGRY